MFWKMAGWLAGRHLAELGFGGWLAGWPASQNIAERWIGGWAAGGVAGGRRHSRAMIWSEVVFYLAFRLLGSI